MAKLTGTLILDSGSVRNEHVSNASADRITTDKQVHVHRAGTNFAVAIGGTPATREEIVYTASAAATVRLFRAMLNVDGSSTSITFDLKKNGVSILSSVITVTDSTGNRVIQDGTLSSTTLAADDVLSISMTVSSSTGASGPWAEVWVEESGTPA